MICKTSRKQDSGLIPIEGGELWYRRDGLDKQRTPLLIVHGGPGFSHHYLLSHLQLSEHRPIIFYDQLDAGDSSRTDDPKHWTVDRFVGEIDSVRDALQLDEFFLLGNSWGGTLAAAYAAQRPTGLRGLVLSSPLIEATRWIADNRIYRDALPDDVIATLDLHESNHTTDSPDYQDAVMVFNQRHFCRLEDWPHSVNKSLDVANMTCYSHMWGPNEFTCTGTLHDYDGQTGLANIVCPTLYVCGEFDEATPSACDAFAALTPDAKVHVIADASHLGFVEKPDQYMPLVEDFLREIEHQQS